MTSRQKLTQSKLRSGKLSDPDQLELEWLPGRFAILRLKPNAPIPRWCHATPKSTSRSIAPPLLSVTRTSRELSIVVDETLVPPRISNTQRGFAAMQIVGRLDFNVVGVLAKLTGALAKARVPVFAISTHDTDILLIRARHTARASQALKTMARFVVI